MTPKKEPKLALSHPGADAHPLILTLWYASGPGRAWKWEQWARAISKTDPRHSLACDVLRKVKEIRVCYRKGATARAGILIERLAQTRYKDAYIRLIPDAERGRGYSRTQSKRAQKRRVRVSDDGGTITDMIGLIATNPEHADETATELWPYLFAGLEEKELAPEDLGDAYEYDFKGGRRRITLKRFKNQVSSFRIKSR